VQDRLLIAIFQILSEDSGTHYPAKNTKQEKPRVPVYGSPLTPRDREGDRKENDGNDRDDRNSESKDDGLKLTSPMYSSINTGM